MTCISSAVSTSMEIDLIFKGIKTVQDCTVHLPQARTVEIDLI